MFSGLSLFRFLRIINQRVRQLFKFYISVLKFEKLFLNLIVPSKIFKFVLLLLNIFNVVRFNILHFKTKLFVMPLNLIVTL